MKKASHGGKREGAGRKPGKKAFKNVEKKEGTKVIRVPLSLVETVEKLIEDYNEFKQQESIKKDKK